MSLENCLIFDSQNYQQCNMKIISEIKMLKKGTINNESIIRKTEFNAKRVEVLNRIEYIQINIEFDLTNANTGESEYYLAREAFDISSLMDKYKDSWLWNTIKIIPNSKSPNTFLYINDILTVSAVKQEYCYKMILMCPIEKAYVKVNEKEAPWDSITTYIEYNTLNQNEYNFLVNIVKKQYQDKTLNNIKNQGSELEQEPEKIPKTKRKLFQKKSKHKKAKYSFLDPENEYDAAFADYDESIDYNDGIVDPEEELNKLIGLDNVKNEINKLKAKLEYQKIQKERKICVDKTNSLHMVFLGNPGTGKTTVARIITGILYNMGYIRENKCVEINGQSLKGGYVGQTAEITKEALRNSKGRVLFIDEAYGLYDEYENGYGKEAVAVLLKDMEDDRANTTIIFAGYEDEMNSFLNMNDGLRSRINRYITFENYTPKELIEILMLLLKEKHLYITQEALTKCYFIFKQAVMAKKFSNGRFVRNLLEKIEDEHAYNMHFVSGENIQKDTININDITDDIVNELITMSM